MSESNMCARPASRVAAARRTCGAFTEVAMWVSDWGLPQAQVEYLAALDEGIAEADHDEVVDADEVFGSLRTRLERMRAEKL